MFRALSPTHIIVATDDRQASGNDTDDHESALYRLARCDDHPGLSAWQKPTPCCSGPVSAAGPDETPRSLGQCLKQEGPGALPGAFLRFIGNVHDVLGESLHTAFGAGIIGISQPLLPWGLAFAAGAMLYVISHEIIPETHRSGHQNRATFGLAVGLVIMLFLDVWLG